MGRFTFIELEGSEVLFQSVGDGRAEKRGSSDKTLIWLVVRKGSHHANRFAYGWPRVYIGAGY